MREMVKEGERQGETERARSLFISCSMVGIIHRVTSKEKHLHAAAGGYQKGYMCTPFLDFHCVVRLSCLRMKQFYCKGQESAVQKCCRPP